MKLRQDRTGTDIEVWDTWDEDLEIVLQVDDCRAVLSVNEVRALHAHLGWLMEKVEGAEAS